MQLEEIQMPRKPLLTPKEDELVRELYNMGHGAPYIASKLKVSIGAISSFRHSALKKLLSASMLMLDSLNVSSSFKLLSRKTAPLSEK